MKKPYLAWWYPGFRNPDKNHPIEFVALCTVDNEINIKFRHKPSKYPDIIRLVSDLRPMTDFSPRDDANGNYMVIMGGGGKKITMDKIAEQLDLLARLHPSLNSNWFRQIIARDKKDAGLQKEDAADYDVFLHGNDNPNLERIICSKYGGTIQLKEDADQQIKDALLGLRHEAVTFSQDGINPNNIQFRWNTPLRAIGSDRPEYLSIKKICHIINPVLNVEAGIKAMNSQSSIGGGY